MTTRFEIKCVSILAVFLGICGFASEEPSETLSSDAAQAYSQVLVRGIEELSRQFKGIVADKSAVAQKLYLLTQLGDKRAALSSQILLNKKISEERKAIWQREHDTIEEQMDKLLKSLLRQYPIPTLLLSDAAGKEKKPSQEKFLVAIERLSPSSFGSGDSKANLECFKKDLLKDQSCVENVMRACRSDFGAAGGKLKHTSLDSELTRVEKIFEGPEEALAFARDKNPKVREFEVLEQLMVGACGLLAAEKFPFSENSITLSEAENTQWLYDLLTYPVGSREDFSKACMPVTSNRQERLMSEQNAGDVSEQARKDFKRAVQRLHSVCRKLVQAECDSYEILKDGDVAKHYITVGCEVRAVTSDDIERDVSEWTNYNAATKADRLRHSEMRDEITFCKNAKESGFFWSFHQPAVKGCKKPKK